MIEDKKIVELFFERSEQAIPTRHTLTNKKDAFHWKASFFYINYETMT